MILRNLFIVQMVMSEVTLRVNNPRPTVLTSEPSVRCVSGVLVCVSHPGSVYWSLVCGSELITVPALSRRRGSRWNRPATEEKILGK